MLFIGLLVIFCSQIKLLLSIRKDLLFKLNFLIIEMRIFVYDNTCWIDLRQEYLTRVLQALNSKNVDYLHSILSKSF